MDQGFDFDSRDVSPVSLQCVAKASVKYEIPEALLLAILKKEGGKSGMAMKNTNGTYDLGPAQVNTAWLDELVKYGIDRTLLKNNGCLNVHVGAWILSRHYVKSKDWTAAVIWYHTGPNAKESVKKGRGTSYARDVIQYWHEYHEISKNHEYSPVRYYLSKGYK